MRRKRGRSDHLWELVCGVRDEHAGLADGAVAHHHALDRLRRELALLHGRRLILRVFVAQFVGHALEMEVSARAFVCSSQH